ncbi:MAG: transaminase [Ilumatobacteraceae bacterium]
MTAAISRPRLRELLAREEEDFVRRHPRSAALAAEASEHLLAGVPMAWMRRWPGAFPLFVDEAAGGRFTDVDGLEYVDLCLGDTGAMGGHALPAVAAAVADRAARGSTTMLPTADAAWVAGELTRRFGLPAWQFALSATDANRFALRLARHATGRPKVLVFDWCYHGTVDETMVVLDTGRVVPRGGSLGPPVDPAATTVVVPFNDVDALRQALGVGDVACVLAEPALTNIGIVLPDAGFHDELRRLTRETGTLLVIDETHTICAGPGGYTAAHGLDPDLLVIGKPIGGGVPAAAYGLSAALAAAVRAAFEDPSIDVSGIGGTLAGNAMSAAAMRAALATSLRAEDFAVSIPLAGRFTAGAADVIAGHGLPWHVQQLGCRAEYWFCPPPRDGAAAASAGDAELEALLHLHALNRGVLLTPFHNMALFTPHHVPADADRHTVAFVEALDELLGPTNYRPLA